VFNKLNGCGCGHVLDDFLFVGQGNSPLCGQTLSSFLDLLTDIGLPIKQEKTVMDKALMSDLASFERRRR
jgi:hypothetical protein